jgi:formate dehydrogenase major subunit
MLRDLINRWPVIRQLRNKSNGTGADAMSQRTRNLRPKNEGAEVARSVCPYCGVGCGQLIFHKQGKLISIEGDPASPISRGHLCPKGANSFELLTNPGRLTKVRYRRPYSTHWEDLDLETAMDMVADRVQRTRDAHWEERLPSGAGVARTMAIAHLGGATLDNEENYLLKKLYTALGIIQVENQARI